jgi:hypothetical protein
MIDGQYLPMVLPQLAGAIPALLFWIAVIVFGAVMLGRGGGRAERFVIAGGVVEIVAALLRLPVAILPLMFVRGNAPVAGLSAAYGIYGIVISIINAGGIALLIYAFWLKFKWPKSSESTIDELERGPHDASPG